MYIFIYVCIYIWPGWRSPPKLGSWARPVYQILDEQVDSDQEVVNKELSLC